MLKTLATFVLSATVFAANAQLNLYIKGGINSTNTSAVKTKYGDIYNHLPRTGFQVGVQAEWAIEDWVYYTGLNIDEKPNYYENEFKTVGYYDYNFTYKPIFLTVPAGLARVYMLPNNVALRVYGGVYASAGVAGSYHDYSGPGLCDVGCPETPYSTGKLQYGKDGDLARANWGVQFGLGIMKSRRFELVSMYSAGFSGIWPSGGGVYNSHLKTISLDFKVHLKTLAAGKKIGKHFGK